jgi:phosphohistidine swiveling domain-containing protein
MDAVQRLVEWYLKRFPGASESEPYVLVQGLSNTSVENGHRLWELAQMEPGPAFDRALAAYLDEFGYRAGPPELAWPLWRDDPAPALALVRQYRESGAPDPKAGLAELGARREAFTAEVRARLAPAELAEFDDLLATALAANPIREDHAFWLDQQSGALLPPIYREIGRRLARVPPGCGAIDDLTDVGFLTLDELQAWTFGCSEPLRPRVDARKAEHERDRDVALPAYIGAPPAPPSEDGWADRMMGPMGPTEAPAGEVRGIAASAGTARGPARIARTLEDARALRRGEILVCPATDPDWAPLFGIAAALVTDSGGSLCHGAVVAREYALPAVVGTYRATATIRTGQVVEVDGAAGLVRLGPFADG